MKRVMVVVACAVVAVVVAGCIPGEATIKLSAEDVRRVLKGEVVEVPVHGEVEISIPIAEMLKEWKRPGCQGCCQDLTNAVTMAERRACAATRVMTLLLADGSSVTGGVKVAGSNVVRWATVQ